MIVFEDHFKTDDDEDFDLFPFDSTGHAGSYAAQTTQNIVEPIAIAVGDTMLIKPSGSIHVEFKYSETMKRFSSAWWKEFAKGSERVDRESINAVIVQRTKDSTWYVPRGTEAIVTGLLGLDAVHGGHSELHPVWAIALHTKSNASDDTWEIFVRNSGNEGFCSQEQHYLDLLNNTFRLTLPWRVESAGPLKSYDRVEVLSDSDFFSSSQRAKGPFETFVNGQPVVLDFVLPPPEQRAVIHGDLHLRWHPATGPLASLDSSALVGEREARLRMLSSVLPTKSDTVTRVSRPREAEIEHPGKRGQPTATDTIRTKSRKVIAPSGKGPE